MTASTDEHGPVAFHLTDMAGQPQTWEALHERLKAWQERQEAERERWERHREEMAELRYERAVAEKVLRVARYRREARMA